MTAKNSPQTYTMDSKVVFLMMFIALIGLFFMAFRYKNKQPCNKIDFSFRTANKFDVAFSNEPVFFSAMSQGAERWQWDYGDNTPVDKSSGPYPSHIYKKPGVYTVRLKINNECEEIKTININSREKEGKKLVIRVQWPPEPLYAGREYYFTDSTTGAETWSWFFDNEPKRSRQSLAYQFLEPGSHKVVLVINDGNNRIERNFNVLPAQTPAASPRSRRNATRSTNNNNSDIQEETTAKPLTDYIDNKAKAESKTPMLSDNGLRIAIIGINGNGYNEIRKYLSNNSFANCTIIFNNRSMSIDQLKENIKVHAKYGKTLTVKQDVDGQGYIKSIEITAELKAKNRLIGKDKERAYPY
jgi:PKD repeat protein